MFSLSTRSCLGLHAPAGISRGTIVPNIMYVCGQNCLSIEHSANESTKECAKRKKEEQQEIALHYIGKCTTV